MKTIRSRLIALILALCMAFGAAAVLAGCDEGDPNAPVTDSTGGGSSEDDPTGGGSSPSGDPAEGGELDKAARASFAGVDLDFDLKTTIYRITIGEDEAESKEWFRDYRYAGYGVWDYLHDQADLAVVKREYGYNRYSAYYLRRGTLVSDSAYNSDIGLSFDPLGETFAGKEVLDAIAERAKGETYDSVKRYLEELTAPQKAVRSASSYDVAWRLLHNALLMYETDYAETAEGYEKVIPVTGENGLLKQLTDTTVQILELADFEVTTLADLLEFLPVKQMIEDLFEGIAAEEILPIATLAYAPLHDLPKPEAEESVYAYLTNKAVLSTARLFSAQEEGQTLGSLTLQQAFGCSQAEALEKISDFGTGGLDGLLASWILGYTFDGRAEADIRVTLHFGQEKELRSLSGTMSLSATTDTYQNYTGALTAEEVEAEMTFSLVFHDKTPSPVTDLAGAWYKVTDRYLHMTDGEYTVDLAQFFEESEHNRYSEEQKAAFWETYADRKIVATVSGGNTLTLEWLDGTDRSLGKMSYCYDNYDRCYSFNPYYVGRVESETRFRNSEQDYCIVNWEENGPSIEYGIGEGATLSIPFFIEYYSNSNEIRKGGIMESPQYLQFS